MWDEAAKKFKFAVGDVVIHITTARQGQAAPRYVVVERSLSQCHGGIQRHYVIRSVFHQENAQRGQPLVHGYQGMVNEIELAAAPAAPT